MKSTFNNIARHWTFFLMSACLINALDSIAQQFSDQQQISPSLSVGNPAPKLEIVKWLNGKPVPKFGDGKVYLVEFGFLACAPCRKSIPELAKLANDYRDAAAIISIHVWENNRNQPENLSYIDRVEKFVKNEERIHYRVAIDVPEQKTADLWLKASGISAAPAVFIVDREGRIAWIGSTPDMEKALDDVVKGKEPELPQTHLTKLLEQYVNKLWQTGSKGDTDESLAAIDSLIEVYPEMTGLHYDKIRMLLKWQEKRGQEVVRTLLKKNASWLRDYLFYLIPALTYQHKPDYDLALKVCDMVLESCNYTPTSALILQSKAEIYFRKGEKELSIATQKNAIELLRSNYGSDDPDIEELILSMVLHLDRYKNK